MVPARRKSKAAKGKRRSHHALRPLNLTACPRCETATRPHRACGNCGYVNSKVAIPVPTEEK